MSTAELTAIERLRRDVRLATDLTDREARYLVDAYYTIQTHRIEAQNQVRALTASEEPNAVLAWLFEQHEMLEREIQKILDTYTDKAVPGVWMKSITGVGPILAAGLLAHIDIEQAPTVGHIWRFAGLDPTREWIGTEAAKKIVREVLEERQDGKGKTISAETLATIADRVNMDTERFIATATEEGAKPTADSLARLISKRPWNARLKVVCWKLGESFVKVSGNDRDVYGKVYIARKAFETERNLRGAYADQAEVSLATKNFGRDTSARIWYSGALTEEQGRMILDAPAATREGMTKKLAGEPGSGVAMLPPARIHARAKRYAVKLFLAHVHHVMYETRFNEAPPLPYVLTHMGDQHVHYIGPPNWPMA